MQLKNVTDASAGGAAAEHAEHEFHVDDALAADQPLQSTGEHGVPAFSSQPLRAAHYPNVFGSPDSALSDALLWARANAGQPQIASWLEACDQWDAAIVA